MRKAGSGRAERRHIMRVSWLQAHWEEGIIAQWGWRSLSVYLPDQKSPGEGRNRKVSL